METKIKISTFIGAVAISMPAILFAADEQAEKVLKRGLEDPTVSYEGTMTVTHWYGPHTKSEEVHVRFKPPRSYRREFLRPDGSVVRVVVSNGEHEEVQLIHSKKNLIGSAAKCSRKKMPPETEWGLLEKNYQLSLVGSQSVSGRPAWVVRLTPLVEGKLIQQLWLDKETGVILENKRFRPKGNFVVLSQYTEFHTGPSFEATLFQVHSVDEAEDHNFSPDFLSKEELQSNTGRTSSLPARLPYGFEFESADFFTVDGKAVDHARYTDGVSVLSVFETAKPVRMGRAEERFTENGTVAHVKSGGKHFTAVSDVSNDLLQEIIAPLK